MRRRAAALAGLALLLTDCAAPAPRCEAGLTPTTSLTAMFGQALPGGAPLPPGTWEGFLASELTPRFPAGYTVTQGMGGWRNRQGVALSEPTRLFHVLVPVAGAAAARAALEQAMAAWMQQASQEAVGLVVQPACTAGLL